MDAAGNEIGPAPLALDRSTDGYGRVCLTVSGEIDISNLARLHEAVSAILAEPHVTGLLLDFAGLDFIDSSGVEVLMRGKRAADRRGIGFGLLNAHGKVQRVLAILGVDKVLAPTEQHRP
jgi:anti-sigma B factor antagonist